MKTLSKFVVGAIVVSVIAGSWIFFSGKANAERPQILGYGSDSGIEDQEKVREFTKPVAPLEQVESRTKDENTNDVRKSNSRNMIQTAIAGEVEINAMFMNPNQNDKEFWIFQLAMDTHSVDLDKINLLDSLMFVDDNGIEILEGFEIKKEGEGHHVSRYIKLKKHIDGKDTILKEFKEFTMVLMNIDGVERTELTWDMTAYPNIFDH